MSQVKGFKELNRMLTQLPVNVEKRVLQSAVTGAIREAAREIRVAAPRHADKQSEASKKYGPLSKNIVVYRLRRVKGNQKGARVSTGDAFWGHFYELGTRYQQARPWFAPAFRRAYESMLRSLSGRIVEGIDKEIKKLGGKRL